jgi:hypothetical protein
MSDSNTRQEFTFGCVIYILICTEWTTDLPGVLLKSVVSEMGDERILRQDYYVGPKIGQRVVRGWSGDVNSVFLEVFIDKIENMSRGEYLFRDEIRE